MKKIIFLILLLMSLSACAKTKFSILEFNYISSDTDRNIAFNALDFDLDIDEDDNVGSSNE